MRDRFFAALRAGDIAEIRRMCGDHRINKERLDALWVDPEGRKVVHILASSGNLEILRFLIPKYRLDLSVRTRVGGDTPLGLAASAGHAEVVAYLLAKLDRSHVSGFYCSEMNHARLSPIQLARQNGHEEVAQQIESHWAQRARHAIADNVDWVLAGMQGQLPAKFATSLTGSISRAIASQAEGSDWEGVMQASASVLYGAATVGSMLYMPEYYVASWALNGMLDRHLSPLLGSQGPYTKAGIGLLGDLATMWAVAPDQDRRETTSAPLSDGRVRDPVGQGQARDVRRPPILSEMNSMFRARAADSSAASEVRLAAHTANTNVRSGNTIYLISEPFRVWSYLWSTARHTGFLLDDGEHLWKMELDSCFIGGCSNQFNCVQMSEYRVETESTSGRWVYELGQTDMTIEQFQTHANDWFASGHATYKPVSDNCRALANHLLNIAFRADGARLTCQLWSGFREFLQDPSRYIENEIRRGGGMNVSGRIRAGADPQATFNVRQAF